MPKLKIDQQELDVPAGSTVLDAARKLGIDIPVLCHLDGYAPATSCLTCVVKINGQDRLVPSCATVVADGMCVESETESVRLARKTALDLLFSDHLGDCISPCHRICPVQLNVPLLCRQVAAGELHDAIVTIRSEVPLPAVLGRICQQNCEKGCRRAIHDDPVAIRAVERYAADTDLASSDPYVPPCKPPSGKAVAIIGAGPAGLSAAYFLQRDGHACTLFDDCDLPGGMLRRGVPDELLPPEVLDAEIAVIRRMGADFRLGRRVWLADVREDFDAVLIAAGKLDDADAFGLQTTSQGIQVQRSTFTTGMPGVFAAGDVVQATRRAVRAMGEAKAAAAAIHQHLSGLPATGLLKPFTCAMGKLQPDEVAELVETVRADGRVEPTGARHGAMSAPEARIAGERCLHCDCRKAECCSLRICADKYGVDIRRYQGDRRRFSRYRTRLNVTYEPGKCIACGRCVRITQRAQDALGLTFIGRGFDIRVGAPLDASLSDGLGKIATKCVEACPTAALSLAGRGPAADDVQDPGRGRHSRDP